MTESLAIVGLANLAVGITLGWFAGNYNGYIAGYHEGFQKKLKMVKLDPHQTERPQLEGEEEEEGE